ncbi:MAG TPA: DUF1566 domain-containing protein [Ferruginibacter sp.]|nr:DUF1566 domain-containing protein [Ferruginibacter sp.]
MKTSIMLLALIYTANIYAQVGIGTTTPNSSAVLDLNSTTKGLLLPRMTAAQRDLIPNPVEGLFIWCTNCGGSGEAQIFNGSFWITMSQPLVIGQNFRGGIVGYILQPGDPGYIATVQHGLIVAPMDQSTGAQWGCSGTLITGADGTALGTGKQNTLDIVNDCATIGIAARICNNLGLGGYSDWYLPSRDELDKLYLNRVAIGGLANTLYWSSSESEAGFAIAQNFNGGDLAFANKSILYNVRAVRSF